MPFHVAYFRFYEELNDLLPKSRKKREFEYSYDGKPSIKDAIEALGVPHTEVDLILANDRSVGFGYHLKPGDRFAVYPVFERFDISELQKLRPVPLRKTTFILDVHLGKLAKLLRLAGFDSYYRNDLEDEEIIDRALAEKRIILTRDRGILKQNRVTHGALIHSKDHIEQAQEVISRFDLSKTARPFSRCLECNGIIKAAARDSLGQELPGTVGKEYKEFFKCESCAHVYWKGSHYDKLVEILDKLLPKK